MHDKKPLSLPALIRGLSGRLINGMNMLAETGGVCLHCGKSRFRADVPSAEPPLPGLCGACAVAVPWIRSVRCPRCGRPVACGDCARRAATHFTANRSAVSYDETMKGMLALYKYRGSEALEQTLAAMLQPAFRRLTWLAAAADGQAEADRSSSAYRSDRRLAQLSGRVWDAVTFVPISAVRADERGFNQAERLARLVAAKHGLPMISLLNRTRHSGKMSFKTRGERMRDIRALFAAEPGGLDTLESLLRAGAGKGRAGRRDSVRILLVDDIYTTGATVNACSGALRKAAGPGMDVYTLTWARS